MKHVAMINPASYLSRYGQGPSTQKVTIPHFSTYHWVTKMGFHKILSVCPTENFSILCTEKFEELVPFSTIKCKNCTSDHVKIATSWCNLIAENK